MNVADVLTRCALAGWAAVSMQWGAWAGSGMAITHNLLPRIIKSGAPFARNTMKPPFKGAAQSAISRSTVAPAQSTLVNCASKVLSMLLPLYNRPRRGVP